MKPIRNTLAAVAVLALVPAIALPQTLPNLAIVRLGYTVRKRTVNPQGELKEKIDAIDRELAEATRFGKIGEVRRLLAKGMTLMAGNTWTDELDFSNSLALRADRVFVDSSRPYSVRLEQIYSSSLALERIPTAHVTLRKPPAGRGQQSTETLKDLGTFEEVSRDLRESPYLMELDLKGVADGMYQIHAEILDEARSLGSANLRVVAYKGLDTALSKIESEASEAPDTIRADALFPIDYIRNVNRARIDIGQFDVAKEIANAEKVLAAGKDPFAGRTGDMKRHYFFEAAGEIMPYRLYVPTAYTGERAFPLVVALHGLGGNEDSMFGQNYKVIPEAEQRGYIVVAPMGYRVDGGYGRAIGGNRRSQLSEQDVMEVLKRVRQEYKIDDRHIYLLGHSMGAIGTWTLGPKYPDLWAVLAPIAGTGDPATIQKTHDIPEIVVHGDADNTVPVDGSRRMVAEMKRLGVEVKYIEVPGGSHTDIAGPNMAAIFDFFDAHAKK